MTGRRKTYWQSVSCYTQSDKDSITSWFPFLSDGMTPYKAEILCDFDTDREKKLRAFMVDKDGKRFVFTRTRGGKRGFVVIRQPVDVDTGGDAPEVAT